MGDLGSDVGEGVIGYYFTVPEGFHQITITIIQEGAPSRTVTFCPSPVGGVMMPVNTFAILGQWLALIGLVACIGTAVVVAKKRR